MIFKTDQEPAIIALKERIIESLGKTVEVIPEESLVDDHQANGEIENAIREFEKQIRVLKSSVERKMQRRPSSDGLDPAARGFSPQPVSGFG